MLKNGPENTIQTQNLKIAFKSQFQNQNKYCIISDLNNMSLFNKNPAFQKSHCIKTCQNSFRNSIKTPVFSSQYMLEVYFVPSFFSHVYLLQN